MYFFPPIIFWVQWFQIILLFLRPLGILGVDGADDGPGFSVVGVGALGVVLGIQQDPLQGKIDPLPLQIDPLPLPVPLKILVHHQVHQLQFKEAVKKVV